MPRSCVKCVGKLGVTWRHMDLNPVGPAAGACIGQSERSSARCDAGLLESARPDSELQICRSANDSDPMRTRHTGVYLSHTPYACTVQTCHPSPASHTHSQPPPPSQPPPALCIQHQRLSRHAPRTVTRTEGSLWAAVAVMHTTQITPGRMARAGT